MLSIGIDPGKFGAVAMHNGRLLRVESMPLSNEDVDPAILADLLEEMLQGRDRPDKVILEHQHAMPKQGVSSSFMLGKRYGLIIGICACLDWPVEVVTPAKWKRVTGTPRDKDGARARASALMPEGASEWRLKRHDGRAEAALLAWYGAQLQ